MLRLIVLSLLSISSATASTPIECIQIPDTEIFAGDQFYLPYNNTKDFSLPGNFDCTYTIKAPINKNGDVLYGTVQIINLMQGPNDKITVTDCLGDVKTFGYRSDSDIDYDIFPNRFLTVRIVTKSVVMGSHFWIHVKYFKANVGPTTTMKRGGAMNYVDLSQVMGYSAEFPCSRTIVGTEQISMSPAVSRYMYPTLYMHYSYVIDGTFDNQTSVHRLMDFVYAKPFVSTTNTITIVSFQKDVYYDTAVVLNPLSEAKKFTSLTAEASTGGDMEEVNLNGLNGRVAVEILAVQARQITIDALVFNGPITSSCIAQVVTGPPNAQSQLLLDLTKAEFLMPYTLKLKYFSVIAENCSFIFSVASPAVN